MNDRTASPGTLLVVAVNWCHDEPLDAHRLNEAYALVDRARSRRPIEFLTGGSLPQATNLTRSPNGDGWTILVAESQVTEAQQDWIRRHWREGVEDLTTFNLTFLVPVGETAPPPVRRAYRVKPERWDSRDGKIGLVNLLAHIVAYRDAIERVCVAVEPTLGGPDACYGHGAACWMRVAVRFPTGSSVLDRIVTAVYNDHATPEQQKQLLAYLEPA